MNKNILKNFITYSLSSLIISIWMYFYQIFMWRLLSVWEYWNLNSMISYYTIISIPIFALWIFITKYISKFHEEENNTFLVAFKRMVSKNILLYFGIYYLLLLLISPLFLYFFHNFSFIFIFLIIISSFIFTFFSFYQNINYAEKNVKSYWIIWFIDIFIRILSWLFFVYIWFWYLWAFAWFLIWNIVWILVNVLVNKSRFFNKDYDFNVDLDYKNIKSFIIPTILISSFWIFFNNIDLIYAKIILSEENLWYYSAITISSRIIVFWLTIFSSFILPYFTNYSKYKKLIIFIYILIFLWWIVWVWLFYFFPNFIIYILLWNKYSNISNYLFIWAIIWFIYVLINLILNHKIVTWSNKYSYIWYIFIFIVSFSVLYHIPTNFVSFLFIIFYSYILSFLILISLIFWKFLLKRKKFKKQKYI